MHPILQYLREQIRNTPFDGQVFVAGGYVRDLLLNRESEDIDLVITRPEGGTAFADWICSRAGCRTGGNPVIFERFGTAKFNLRVPGLPEVDIEAVMPRVEVYTPGSRNPDVQYTTLTEDAKRRDFTINAMFFNISTGEILDLVGGKDDLRKGVIRTAIDPELIFVDDPLRMMRAIRFSARFGWVLDTAILQALPKNAHRIQSITQERLNDELSKMLVSARPSWAIRLMQASGLLDYVLPEIATLKGVTQNKYHEHDVYDHTLAVLDGTPADLCTRLGALFHDAGKPDVRSVDEDGAVHFYDHETAGVVRATAALTRLRFSNEILNSVNTLVAQHMRLKQSGLDGTECSDKALRKLKADLGDELDRLLDLMHADNIAHAEQYAMPEQVPGIRKRLSELKVQAKITLPVSGHDVMQEFGLKPGREVGVLLDLVKEAWFSNPDITREQALELLRVVQQTSN
jgi:poly(A) polymerase